MNGWIACRDRMPDTNDDVLGMVWFDDVNLPPEFVIVAYDLNAWRSDTGKRPDITHWRPIPTPTDKATRE